MDAAKMRFTFKSHKSRGGQPTPCPSPQPSMKQPRLDADFTVLKSAPGDQRAPSLPRRLLQHLSLRRRKVFGPRFNKITRTQRYSVALQDAPSQISLIDATMMPTEGFDTRHNIRVHDFAASAYRGPDHVPRFLPKSASTVALIGNEASAQVLVRDVAKGRDTMTNTPTPRRLRPSSVEFNARSPETGTEVKQPNHSADPNTLSIKLVQSSMSTTASSIHFERTDTSTPTPRVKDNVDPRSITPTPNGTPDIRVFPARTTSLNPTRNFSHPTYSPNSCSVTRSNQTVVRRAARENDDTPCPVRTSLIQPKNYGLDDDSESDNNVKTTAEPDPDRHDVQPEPGSAFTYDLSEIFDGQNEHERDPGTHTNSGNETAQLDINDAVACMEDLRFPAHPDSAAHPDIFKPSDISTHPNISTRAKPSRLSV